MMLGDILAAARSSSAQFHGWLAATDPDLAELVAESAAADGMGPGSYVRAAVADFAAAASEEDWATLTSSMRNTDDPGTACLLAMVHWRLTAPDCGCHGSEAASRRRTG